MSDVDCGRGLAISCDKLVSQVYMKSHLTPLVDALFASVLENPPWSSFLELLERHLPCRNATIVLRMPRRSFPGMVISTTGDEWSLAMFQSQEVASNFLQTL